MVLKYRRFLVSALMVLAGARAHAIENENTDREPAAAPPTSTYVYFAGGSAVTTPDSSTSQVVDTFKATGGRENTVGVIEALGVYRKRTDHLWVGILPSLVAEEYSGNYEQATALAFSRYSLDASAWWFFEANKSSGFIMRADLGYSYVHEYKRISGSPSQDEYLNGANLKITGGYALPCSVTAGGFWSFNLGLFGVAAGSFSETGADITVGVML